MDAISLAGNGGGGGAGVRVRNVTVPAGATGRQVNLQHLLGSSSTFSLLSGTNANIQLNNGDGLALTAGLAAGATQTAIVQEMVGSGATFRQAAYALNCTGAPVAPSVPAVTPTGGDGQISVAWVDGSNGGSPISSHNIYLDGVLIASPTGASPYVITGLANGTPYSVQVSAVNGVDEGARSSPQSVTPSAAPVAGGILALASMNSTLTTDSGAAPDVTGFVVGITFKGMGRRHPINDPAFDASKVTLTVQDPGFDDVGGVITPVTRTRTVKGTLPLKCPWPQPWTALGSTVPARSYCWGMAGGFRRAYYTELGGTKGATAPTHSVDGQTVSDGGVLWTLIPLSQNTGYVEKVSGSDVTVYVVLDMPLFAGSTITGISIGAGAYVVGSTSSLATTGAGVSVTNNSQLPYPSVILNVITPPHQRSTGTMRVEVAADHGWGIHIGGGRPIVGIRATAWDMSRTNSVTLPDIVSTELSTQYTTSSPGGCAVEVFAPTANTAPLPQGDSFFEFVAYPWLGLPFSTRYDGEGADWRGNQNYPMAGTIVRNGSGYYQLKTPGTSAASGGPTGTTLSADITDGTCVWNYIGADNLIVNSRNIQARWHFYNDPSNLYKIGYCFVDPSGTATGTTGVFSTFAAADAAKGTLSNCYANIAAAETALASYHGTAGGGLTTHSDSGGGRAFLKPGTHAGFGTAMGSRTRGSVWFYVQADPSATPGTVIFGNGPVKAGHPRMWFGDGIYATATATGAANIFFDRAADSTAGLVKQATGELVISGMTYTPFDATFGIQWRNGWVWLLNNTYSVAANIGDPKQQQYGHALVAGNNLQGPLGQVAVPNFIGNTLFCLTAIRDFSAPTVPVMFTMHLDNRIYGPITSPAGVLVFTLAYNAGGNYGYPTLGYSMRGNLIKSSNYGGCKVAQIAADGLAVPSSNVVITYNSGIGQRYNRAYNDSNAMLHTNWYQGFNLWTSWNTVWDSTGHGSNGPDPSRCQNYWVVYDVASAYNVSLNGSESGTAPAINSYSGMRVAPTSAPYALGGSITFASQFVNDTTDVTSSANVSETLGDFRPVAGSVIVNRAAIQAKKFDLLGVARRPDGSGAVGAFERAS
ncbi:fibronectin type III domain-containing protein [Sphingomonas trueperi]|uniref:Fibronectin type-III domain-containing protein n=1 Tax=Sphingomonas trueperi TaxID=53317 RepID=A0A7X6BEN4_9SPHN|nr:fibronectin type III domain-containing protein [Sphingomonas trueperi]NJB99858.1 hypothetical protein [Sphingomonas trueperi]